MHNNNIKLSIIIVSYNEAEYLPECFESILKQNMDFDYEVIVGDDGSSDNSLEVIKSYQTKFKHFSYFVQDREPGLTKKNVIASVRASNVVFRALGMAQGQYVNLASGDDYFVDMDYFKKAVLFLDGHKKYSAYATTFYCVYPDGSRECNDLRSRASFSFWHLQYIHCSCFVFRKLPKNVLLKSFIDDCGLQYSIALNGKIKYVNEHSFAYRQREKSIMHSNDREELDLVEMLLFQDVLNKKVPSIFRLYEYLCLFIITFRHFKAPFFRLRSKQGSFDAEKYKKYTDFSRAFKNDIVGSLVNPKGPKSERLLKKISRWTKVSDFILDRLAKSDYPCLDALDAPKVDALAGYSKKEARIYYSIDRFEQSSKFTFIQGWAFVPNADLQMYIKANGKVYKPPLYSRADVKDAYGASSQNEGFLFKVMDKIKSFEMLLVDESAKIAYSIFFDERFLSKCKLSMMIPKIDGGALTERDFPCCIDVYRRSFRRTRIIGWAYFENDERDVFIEVDGKFYTTRLIRRPDVMKTFSLSDDAQGFSALLPISARSFTVCLVNHSRHEIYKKTFKM